MSQLLAEALQEVQRAEAWALQHVPLLNSTQLSDGRAHPLWRPAYPTIGKLAWLPQARWANLSAPAHNASARALPPWARLHRLRRREPASSRALLQLHAWGEHDDISEPCSTFGCAMPESPPQQSPLLAFAPQLAGVHQFRDQQLGFHILSMNHTKPCSATQHCSFDSTLAWAVTSTALLACVLTLLAVWLLRKRLLPPPLVQVVCLDKVQGVCTATVREQHADKQCVHAPGSDRM